MLAGNSKNPQLFFQDILHRLELMSMDIYIYKINYKSLSNILSTMKYYIIK